MTKPLGLLDMDSLSEAALLTRQLSGQKRGPCYFLYVDLQVALNLLFLDVKSKSRNTLRTTGRVL